MNSTNNLNTKTPACGDEEGGANRLPPELAGMVLGLDRLGAFERGRVPAGLVDRVCMASAPVLAGQAIAERAGERDRSAVDGGLEDRVYESSRDRIGAETHAGGLRLAGNDRRRRLTKVRRGWSIGLACAAALLLASAAILVQRAPTSPSRPDTQVASTDADGGIGAVGVSANELAMQIDGDFELLFASFGGDSGRARGTSMTEDGETSVDPLLFDDLPTSGGTM